MNFTIDIAVTILSVSLTLYMFSVAGMATENTYIRTYMTMYKGYEAYRTVIFTLALILLQQV